MEKAVVTTMIAVMMIMMIAAVVGFAFHYGVLITWLHSILQVLWLA